ncbi:hypothetical protein [Okeania sp. SIO3B5]|uniref:hypothetical protein n=1 Tax=Okeania sp. SIO3B5 TaxID=2607811 RepID=UPI0025FF3882|nr:hypothetical protein [Okeania sp. SIO3B5]
MGGLPLREAPHFLEAIDQLKKGIIGILDQQNFLIEQFSATQQNKSDGIDCQYTLANYPLLLEAGTPYKIVEIKDPGNYQILISNPNKSKVLLYLGDEGGENFTDSAWELPVEGLKIEGRERTIWALSEKQAQLIITIHSENPSTKIEEEVPIPLNIIVDCPTGEKFNIPEDFGDYSGFLYLEEKGDSELGITGHKLFAFGSYDFNTALDTGYEFEINIDDDFSSVVYPEDGNFLEVHSISSNLIDRANIWSLLGWQETYNLEYLKFWKETNSWVSTGKRINGEVKFKNASDPSILTDKLLLKPNFFSRYYLIKIRLEDNYWGSVWKNAVFSFDSKRNVFNVLGY